MLDPVKFTEDLSQSMVNMLWMGPVSENGAQCLGMVKTDVHDAERSGRPSVITDALKQKVNHIIQENWHFKISEVYKQCPEVSRTAVYEIVTEHLQYCKICARWARQPSGTRRE